MQLPGILFRCGPVPKRFKRLAGARRNLLRRSSLFRLVYRCLHERLLEVQRAFVQAPYRDRGVGTVLAVDQIVPRHEIGPVRASSGR